MTRWLVVIAVVATLSGIGGYSIGRAAEPEPASAGHAQSASTASQLRSIKSAVTRIERNIGQPRTDDTGGRLDVLRMLYLVCITVKPASGCGS